MAKLEGFNSPTKGKLEDCIQDVKRELARKQAEHAARQAANLQTQIAPTETIRPPNRLQSLLVSSRINNYCLTAIDRKDRLTVENVSKRIQPLNTSNFFWMHL